MADIAATEVKKAKPKRGWLYRTGKKLRPKMDEILARSSLVGNPPVFAHGTFAWTAELENNWETIRREAASVMHGEDIPVLADISPDHGRLGGDRKWKSFFLYGYGYKVDANCEKCPETAKLVSRVPGLNSAFFSILAPGARIPRHRGVTKTLLTCHLGLFTPKDRPSCRMAVHDDMVHWDDGKTVVFDDTYYHEVWNETDETRVILLVQFERPMRQPGKAIGRAFLGAVRRSPFVQEARKNFLAWQGAQNRIDGH
ncbi:aspartyl/asparaginyl beta-hydroxylase domain-containing protein [Hansschlegelia quercus]|uniref:Aspartyl/asparaginyl beta-hydroxylase domain-containing protein n=1 Tax=Hansschlegelia quercus TaxID=2528245 RepID=A0A4Q9GIW8_9HYPH|nr:aspartyl/asparaginyl beta-hydroxylase domain-containing protein [Hansschlegelia quercus]TBN54199.1 aspartyl/asparaginyl beta-hydroxylase domain-containing protein [Hansschlegelia quercus]